MTQENSQHIPLRKNAKMYSRTQFFLKKKKMKGDLVIHDG